MICKNCQTTLPDQAVACWKCGKPIAQLVAQPVAPTPHPVQAPPAPETPLKPKIKKKPPIDPIVAVFTMIASVIFFACIGWAVPFTVWGKTAEIFKDRPDLAQMSSVLGTAGGVLSGLILFVGVWWVSAWIITRLIRSSG